jgi:hypothetical protein
MFIHFTSLGSSALNLITLFSSSLNFHLCFRLTFNLLLSLEQVGFYYCQKLILAQLATLSR